MQADAHYRQIHSRVSTRLNFTVKALETSHIGWLQVLQGLLQVHNKLLENANCEGKINNISATVNGQFTGHIMH